MDVFPNRPITIVVASLHRTVVTLAKNQQMTVTTSPPVVLIHNNDDELSPYAPDFESRQSVNAVNYSSTPDQMDEMRHTGFVQKPDKRGLKFDRREEMNISEAYEKNIARISWPY